MSNKTTYKQTCKWSNIIITIILHVLIPIKKLSTWKLHILALCYAFIHHIIFLAFNWLKNAKRKVGNISHGRFTLHVPSDHFIRFKVRWFNQMFNSLGILFCWSIVTSPRKTLPPLKLKFHKPWASNGQEYTVTFRSSLSSVWPIKVWYMLLFTGDEQCGKHFQSDTTAEPDKIASASVCNLVHT